MKKLISILLIMLFAINTYSQRPINIDSLRKILSFLEVQKKTFANDTLKIKTWQELVTYQSMHTDSANYFIQKMLKLSEEIEWGRGIILSYLSKVEVLSNSDFAEMQKILLKITPLAHELKQNDLLFECYNNWFIFYAYKTQHILAIKYLKLAIPYALKSKQYFALANCYNNLSVSYGQLNNKKQAYLYLLKSLEIAQKYKQPLAEAFALSNIADALKDSLHLQKKMIAYLQRAEYLFVKLNRPIFVAQGWVFLGQIFYKNKEYTKALFQFKKAAKVYDDYKWTQAAYGDTNNVDKNLYHGYKALKQYDKALIYLEKYHAFGDSALKSEIKNKNDIEQALTEKEFSQNAVVKLKTNELILQKRIQLFLISGICLLLLLLFVLLWYNRKLDGKNKDLTAKNEIIKDITYKIQTTEITALRAQMNPHFIFNCLNSIQLYTAQNDPDKASEYLTKFSRLIRLVLDNSKTDKISLTNELETLKLYIEMESMRFRGKVKHEINIADDVDVSFIQIPPLLIQPFVENAIWHGLMHKEEGGIIKITITQPKENILLIEVVDNGIGREKAMEYKSKSATKHKSYGMKITADRIELINQMYQTNTNVKVMDVKNDKNEVIGTKVIIEIPI